MNVICRFLDTAINQPNVWLVTLKQLIEWMQHPVPETEVGDMMMCGSMIDNNSTQTRYMDDRSHQPPPCLNPNQCMYRTPNLNSPEHQFLTCNPCPEIYPWIENPIGIYVH